MPFYDGPLHQERYGSPPTVQMQGLRVLRMDYFQSMAHSRRTVVAAQQTMTGVLIRRGKSFSNSVIHMKLEPALQFFSCFKEAPPETLS